MHLVLLISSILCLRAGHNAALELEEKHVPGIMCHQIDVEEPKLRRCSSLVDFEEGRFVIHGAVLIEPRIQILHRPQPEREGVRGLSSDEWVERRRFLDRGHRAQEAVSATYVELMERL